MRCPVLPEDAGRISWTRFTGRVVVAAFILVQTRIIASRARLANRIWYRQGPCAQQLAVSLVRTFPVTVLYVYPAVVLHLAAPISLNIALDRGHEGKEKADGDGSPHAFPHSHSGADH